MQKPSLIDLYIDKFYYLYGIFGVLRLGTIINEELCVQYVWFKRPCFSLPIHNKCYVITLHKLVVPVSSNIIIWSLHKIFNFSTQRYIGLSKHFHHNFKTSNASYIFEPHH